MITKTGRRTSQMYAVAEAGSISPQLLIQLTPLYWGLVINAGNWYVAWRIGPVAMKLHYGPMFWEIIFKGGCYEN